MTAAPQLMPLPTPQSLSLFYVAQGVRMMRSCKDAKGARCPAFRVAVQCPKHTVKPKQCQIPLDKFNKAAEDAVGAEFLAACINGKEICPRPR